MTNLLTVHLAAGCFWGVQDLLRAVPGVHETVVGYSGGTTPDPTYEKVKTGRTGHAEAIRVVYDPDTITYKELLGLFFRLHDPTTLNRQGGDVGSQYRSAIFYSDNDELREAKEVMGEVASRWPNPLTTTLEPFLQFYPAESYHQDYLKKNPGGYTCHYWRPASHGKDGGHTHGKKNVR